MPISILCPSCRSKFTTADKAVGKNTKCPVCDHSFTIPSPRPVVNQSALPPRAGVDMERLASDLLSEQEADIPAPQQSAAQSPSASRNQWGLEDGQTKPDEGGQQKSRAVLAALADDEIAAKQESAKPRQYYPSPLPLRDADDRRPSTAAEPAEEPLFFSTLVFCAIIVLLLGVVGSGACLVSAADASRFSGSAGFLLLLSAAFSFLLALTWSSLLFLAVDVARKVRSMDRRIREFVEK